jgi:hypothetical protein
MKVCNIFEEDDHVNNEAANKKEKDEEDENEKVVSGSLSAAMKSLAKLNEMMKMDELMMQAYLNKTSAQQQQKVDSAQGLATSLARHHSLSNKFNDSRSLLKVAPLFSPQQAPNQQHISRSSSSSSSSPHLTHNSKLSALISNENMKKLSIESYVMSQTAASTISPQTGITNKLLISKNQIGQQYSAL